MPVNCVYTEMIATIFAIGLGAPEVILIIAVLLLFFGAKKIPALAGSLGKAIGEFKKGKDEGDASATNVANSVDKEKGV